MLGKSDIYTEKKFENIGFEYSGKSYFRNDIKLGNRQTYINIYENKSEAPEQVQPE